MNMILAVARREIQMVIFKRKYFILFVLWPFAYGILLASIYVHGVVTKIPCAVIDGEIRVLSQAGFLRAIGRARSPKAGTGVTSIPRPSESRRRRGRGETHRNGEDNRAIRAAQGRQAAQSLIEQARRVDVLVGGQVRR